MYLVLGSALDDQPHRLVRRWLAVGRDVALATPADLSRAGWRYRGGQPYAARAVAGDRLIGAAELDAVISLLPWVTPADLLHVVDADRDYVAQEMTAFLHAWLHHLPCRVVDPPSTTALTGCGRSAPEWATVAGRVGVAADPRWTGPFITVTVVGTRAASDAPDAVLRAAQRVAGVAGRSLVTLRFADPAEHGAADPVLTGAQLRPEVGDVSTADALLGWLEAA